MCADIYELKFVGSEFSDDEEECFFREFKGKHCCTTSCSTYLCRNMVAIESKVS